MAQIFGRFAPLGPRLRQLRRARRSSVAVKIMLRRCRLDRLALTRDRASPAAVVGSPDGRLHDALLAPARGGLASFVAIDRDRDGTIDLNDSVYSAGSIVEQGSSTVRSSAVGA